MPAFRSAFATVNPAHPAPTMITRSGSPARPPGPHRCRRRTRQSPPRRPDARAGRPAGTRPPPRRRAAGAPAWSSRACALLAEELAQRGAQNAVAGVVLVPVRRLQRDVEELVVGARPRAAWPRAGRCRPGSTRATAPGRCCCTARPVAARRLGQAADRDGRALVRDSTVPPSPGPPPAARAAPYCRRVRRRVVLRRRRPSGRRRRTRRRRCQHDSRDHHAEHAKAQQAEQPGRRGALASGAK